MGGELTEHKLSIKLLKKAMCSVANFKSCITRQMYRLIIILVMVTRSETLLSESQSVVKDLSLFLAANGLRRLTIVAHNHVNDSFLQILHRELSESGKFFMRFAPITNDHEKVSQEDFYIFTPNSVLRNLSRVVELVAKTKVTNFKSYQIYTGPLA